MSSTALKNRASMTSLNQGSLPSPGLESSVIEIQFKISYIPRVLSVKLSGFATFTVAEPPPNQF